MLLAEAIDEESEQIEEPITVTSLAYDNENLAFASEKDKQHTGTASALITFCVAVTCLSMPVCMISIYYVYKQRKNRRS